LANASPFVTVTAPAQCSDHPQMKSWTIPKRKMLVNETVYDSFGFGHPSLLRLSGVLDITLI